MTRGKGSFLEVGKSFARPSVSLQLVSEGSNRMKAFCLVQCLIRCQDYLSSLDFETTCGEIISLRCTTVSGVSNVSTSELEKLLIGCTR